MLEELGYDHVTRQRRLRQPGLKWKQFFKEATDSDSRTPPKTKRIPFSGLINPFNPFNPFYLGIAGMIDGNDFLEGAGNFLGCSQAKSTGLGPVFA